MLAKVEDEDPQGKEGAVEGWVEAGRVVVPQVVVELKWRAARTTRQ